MPYVGVGPGRKAWGVDRRGEWEEGGLSHFARLCCALRL